MRATRTGFATLAVVSAAFVLGCHDVTGPKLGVLRVSAMTTGADLDPDGYTVIIDLKLPGKPVAQNGEIDISDLSEGAHSVMLSGTEPNCGVTNGNPAQVTVRPGATASVAFAVSCSAYLGTLRITTQISGADLDEDGYVIDVDGFTSLISASGGVVTVDKIPAGFHLIVLRDIARNCSVSNGYQHWASVTAAEITEESFDVTCAAFANLRVRAVTTGVDPDPNGYEVLVSGNGFERSVRVTANGTADIPKLVAGTYTVALSGFAVNCDLADAGATTSRAVPATSGATAETVFGFACTRATQLAYVSNAEGYDAIYVVNSNGSGATRLSSERVIDGDPSWSPDGSKIAFRSGPAGNYEIYVMSAAGSDVVRLTNFPGNDYDPVWSPDGSRIAFVSARDDNSEIYVMNADGSGLVRLTNSHGEDADPSWSPDGRKIAFRSDRDGNSELYVMNADGSNVVRLTKNDTYDGEPEWSPDGARITFTRESSCDYYYYYDCYRNLFVMNADGTGAVQLTSDSYDSAPSWSPDGRWIAFVSYVAECDCSGIAAISPDGSDRRQILAARASKPSWRR